MGMSNYLSDKLIRHTLDNVSYASPTSVYLALYTVMPDANNAGGTEVTGGSYARKVVSFGTPTEGVSYNDAVVTFTNMPAATIVGAGILDALTSGNLLFYSAFSEPQAVTGGLDVTVSIGDIVVVMR
jgi:hypothetical protein